MKKKLVAAIVTIGMLTASATVFAAPPGGGPRPGGPHPPRQGAPHPGGQGFHHERAPQRPQPEPPHHNRAPRAAVPRFEEPPHPEGQYYSDSSYSDSSYSNAETVINTIPAAVNALQSIFGLFGGASRTTQGPVSTQDPQPQPPAEPQPTN